MDEIKDDSLDLLIEKKAQELNNQLSTKVENDNIVQTTQRSSFAKKMDDVKIDVLAEASTEDKNFVTTIKNNLKKAAVTHTEVEKDKADLEKQQVQSDSEKLSNQQQKNKHEMAQDKWENKQKFRQYVYDGVKPIMTFVGINDPMSVVLMIFLSFVLLPFFLVSKLWNGTIGLLICGACDGNRSKAMKGLIWTLLAIILICIIFVAIFLFLKWQGIDILEKLR